MKRPRGICSVCGRERRLRATGTIAKHYSLTPQGYNRGTICVGVDQPPTSPTEETPRA
jgi:hypothetical protein